MMRENGSGNIGSQMWLVLVVVATLTGCGSKTDTVAVSGVVTYRGEPVEGAEVALIPRDSGTPAGGVIDRDSEPEARAARGVTDSSGKFTVKTYFGPELDASGARPGEYIVTVTKYLPPEGMTVFEWAQAQSQPNPSVPPLQYLVPKKYSGARTSGLSVTVKKGSDNSFPLELVD